MPCIRNTGGQVVVVEVTGGSTVEVTLCVIDVLILPYLRWLSADNSIAATVSQTLIELGATEFKHRPGSSYFMVSIAAHR